MKFAFIAALFAQTSAITMGDFAQLYDFYDLNQSEEEVSLEDGNSRQLLEAI